MVYWILGLGGGKYFIDIFCVKKIKRRKIMSYKISGTKSDTSRVLIIIEYITISTPSSATAFGDLTLARNSGGVCSNA